MRSKLIEEKRKRELLRLKRLTPVERLKEQAKLCAQVKSLFFAGLSHYGFTREEIIRLWKKKRA